MHILVSVFLSDFWGSPTMRITFLPISLWETKLTFIWMASQTHTTAESGQLRTLCLFMRNHCTLSESQFGVRYAPQMWLVPTSLRMKWAEHLRLQVTFTEQWSPHSLHLQWSARRWIKNGALDSSRMVQPATLQGNQWLVSDNCFPDGWFSDMETFLGHPGLQIWQLQIFLWGHLKERVYQTKTRTFQGTKGLYSQRNP
jgi:hypothetical protein